MALTDGMEEYYQKVIKLQESLRRSEEERLKLEMRYNEMLQTMKEEEETHLKKLRGKYKQFLEEDRRRQQRNDKILEALDRIENRTAIWEAKTQKFKAVRRRYFKDERPELVRGSHPEQLPEKGTYGNLGNINSIYWRSRGGSEKKDQDKPEAPDDDDYRQVKDTKDIKNTMRQNTGVVSSHFIGDYSALLPRRSPTRDESALMERYADYSPSSGHVGETYAHPEDTTRSPHKAEEVYEHPETTTRGRNYGRSSLVGREDRPQKDPEATGWGKNSGVAPSPFKTVGPDDLSYRNMVATKMPGEDPQATGWGQISDHTSWVGREDRPQKDLLAGKTPGDDPKWGKNSAVASSPSKTGLSYRNVVATKTPGEDLGATGWGQNSDHTSWVGREDRPQEDLLAGKTPGDDPKWGKNSGVASSPFKTGLSVGPDDLCYRNVVATKTPGEDPQATGWGQNSDHTSWVGREDRRQKDLLAGKTPGDDPKWAKCSAVASSPSKTGLSVGPDDLSYRNVVATKTPGEDPQATGWGQNSDHTSWVGREDRPQKDLLAGKTLGEDPKWGKNSAVASSPSKTGVSVGPDDLSYRNVVARKTPGEDPQATGWRQISDHTSWVGREDRPQKDLLAEKTPSDDPKWGKSSAVASSPFKTGLSVGPDDLSYRNVVATKTPGEDPEATGWGQISDHTSWEGRDDRPQKDLLVAKTSGEDPEAPGWGQNSNHASWVGRDDFSQKDVVVIKPPSDDPEVRGINGGIDHCSQMDVVGAKIPGEAVEGSYDAEEDRLRSIPCSGGDHQQSVPIAPAQPHDHDGPLEAGEKSEVGANAEYVEQYYEEADGRDAAQYYDQTEQQYYEGAQEAQYYGDPGAEFVQQYDENGQPLIQYDEMGRPLVQYDESGQPLYDPRYDETGQPLYDPRYDENGQLLQTYYDENGQVVQYYDVGEGGGFHQEERQRRENEENPVQEGLAPPRNDGDAQREEEHREFVRHEVEAQPVAEEEIDTKKKSNVLEMLETDTESSIKDTKVSNDSDFDISNN